MIHKLGKRVLGKRVEVQFGADAALPADPEADWQVAGVREVQPVGATSLR